MQCIICQVEIHGRHKTCKDHRGLRKPLGKVKKNEHIKHRLILIRGHRCEICGTTEWCGKPAPIQLDHIDGNRSNNDHSNLRLVCAMCHAQTDTFCGKNKGWKQRIAS